MGAMVASWFMGALGTVAIAVICAMMGYGGMAVLVGDEERTEA